MAAVSAADMDGIAGDTPASTAVTSKSMSKNKSMSMSMSMSKRIDA